MPPRRSTFVAPVEPEPSVRMSTPLSQRPKFSDEDWKPYGAKLTQLASSFQSEVWMSRNGHRVNAKSIMGVMMLAAAKGSSVELETDGPDEQAAMDALVELINDKFGEGE